MTLLKKTKSSLIQKEVYRSLRSLFPKCPSTQLLLDTKYLSQRQKSLTEEEDSNPSLRETTDNSRQMEDRFRLTDRILDLPHKNSDKVEIGAKELDHSSNSDKEL